MKKIFQIILSLIMLGLLGWGGWEAINWYLGILKTLDKQVAAAIIAASTTIIVSVASLILAKHYENKRLIEKDIRDKKIVVYEKLMAYFFKFMGTKDKSKLQSMENFYIEFSPSFLTWGSDEVIRHWSDFRRAAVANDSLTVLANFEKLLLIIRKDIGHKNKGLEQNKTLLAAFINDLDSLYPKN
jgi:hypothetical protein